MPAVDAPRSAGWSGRCAGAGHLSPAARELGAEKKKKKNAAALRLRWTRRARLAGLAGVLALATCRLQRMS